MTIVSYAAAYKLSMESYFDVYLKKRNYSLSNMSMPVVQIWLIWWIAAARLLRNSRDPAQGALWASTPSPVKKFTKPEASGSMFVWNIIL